jgi:hypothetical protein
MALRLSHKTSKSYIRPREWGLSPPETNLLNVQGHLAAPRHRTGAAQEAPPAVWGHPPHRSAPHFLWSACATPFIFEDKWPGGSTGADNARSRKAERFRVRRPSAGTMEFGGGACSAADRSSQSAVPRQLARGLRIEPGATGTENRTVARGTCISGGSQFVLARARIRIPEALDGIGEHVPLREKHHNLYPWTIIASGRWSRDPRSARLVHANGALPMD